MDKIPQIFLYQELIYLKYSFLYKINAKHTSKIKNMIKLEYYTILISFYLLFSFIYFIV